MQIYIISSWPTFATLPPLRSVRPLQTLKRQAITLGGKGGWPPESPQVPASFFQRRSRDPLRLRRSRSRSRLMLRERVRERRGERDLYERRGRRLRSSRLVRPEDISTRMRVPQTLDPSSDRHASSASRLSSNSTKAKPGGLRATHTFLRGPYFPKALSISCLEAEDPRFPTYTLHWRSHSRYRAMSLSPPRSPPPPLLGAFMFKIYVALFPAT